ncbi:hypothetical protein VARIO8X_50275 [Burkholderiales bacterium 8X]|nr:hypothetical protein VARIO8X_50275 [Burkholderiales bacterium 8X]
MGRGQPQRDPLRRPGRARHLLHRDFDHQPGLLRDGHGDRRTPAGIASSFDGERAANLKRRQSRPSMS